MYSRGSLSSNGMLDAHSVNGRGKGQWTGDNSRRRHRSSGFTVSGQPPAFATSRLYTADVGQRWFAPGRARSTCWR
jgi:hypothetical protein